MYGDMQVSSARNGAVHNRSNVAPTRVDDRYELALFFMIFPL
jgi:hypothetical protein